ncbi:MAG TPA: KH domain-containing protein [Polyangiaceae bacterium]|nr:KH domain-containing protein [Polyangiaceae bacterium]
MKELVITIARALVDDPDAIEVREIEDGPHTLVELRVAKSDIGKVIGKDGKTAQSIRMLIAAASQKAGRRVHLDILDGT